MVSGHTLPTTSGSPFSPSQHEEEHIPHAPVADVGEHRHPELGALTAGPGPQPQDVLARPRSVTPIAAYTGRLATCPSRIFTTIASTKTAA